jgi:hypothetical protein
MPPLNNKAGYGGHDAAWMQYLRGKLPDYPERILKDNIDDVTHRLKRIRAVKQPVPGLHYMYPSPLACEALTQLTLGGPLPLYNGGLLIARVRYYDAQRRRPGLPSDVAALVSAVEADRTKLTLANLHADQSRDLVVQAGAMGEHRFTTASFGARRAGRLRQHTVEVNHKFLRVHLPPTTRITLDLGTERFVHAPSYEAPW